MELKPRELDGVVVFDAAFFGVAAAELGDRSESSFQKLLRHTAFAPHPVAEGKLLASRFLERWLGAS